MECMIVKEMLLEFVIMFQNIYIQINLQKLLFLVKNINGAGKKKKNLYAIPEEDTIFVNEDKIEFIGTRTYYEFVNGEMIPREIEQVKNSKLF